MSFKFDATLPVAATMGLACMAAGSLAADTRPPARSRAWNRTKQPYTRETFWRDFDPGRTGKTSRENWKSFESTRLLMRRADSNGPFPLLIV